MTDNIINIQDIKTDLEKTRHNLSSLSFEEVTALTMEQLSNNLIIIADTLEKTIDVVKTLKANDIEIQEQLIQLGDKVDGTKAFYNQIQDEQKRLTILVNADPAIYTELIKELLEGV